MGPHGQVEDVGTRSYRSDKRDAARDHSRAAHRHGRAVALARYFADDLRIFATSVFGAAGLDGEKAASVAYHLVNGDLLGHTTHGLTLAPGYLREIAGGQMSATGVPQVISEHAANAVWDGQALPGPWLVDKAFNRAAALAREHGVATIVMKQSHHIACLASFVERAAERGYIMILASSNPGSAGVAPFGGKKALFTPNPIAMGIPTKGDPILVDISSSVTASGQVDRARARGERLPGAWLLDGDGHPTDDPEALEGGDRPGTILPLGGLDAGHKGFALALMVEALTQGLVGFGRADGPSGWRASIFLQVIDPAGFGGVAAFQRQTQFLAEACRANPPIDPNHPVRLPGERALALKRAQLRDGVEVDGSILMALAPWAARYAIRLPVPLA